MWGCFCDEAGGRAGGAEEGGGGAYAGLIDATMAVTAPVIEC